jgi:hypothetical protein
LPQGYSLDLFQCLEHATIQIKFWHHQTTFYSEHMALGTYYEEIVPLIDGLVESYQGKHGIITGYSNYKLLEYNGNNQTIAYLEQLCIVVDQTYETIDDSYILNQLDTITELIKSTVYKLKNLN